MTERPLGVQEDQFEIRDANGDPNNHLRFIVKQAGSLTVNGDVELPGAGGAPSGSAGGNLGGTYPNPTVVGLTIAGQAQGDILYFDGTNWVSLAAGTADYFLQTKGPAANPVWAAGGGGGGGGAPTGSAGGDLGGTYPNPTVTDLTIASEAQGDILYFNGTNWVRLAPGTATYVLTTQGAGANPTWSAPSGGSGNPLAEIWGEEFDLPNSADDAITAPALIQPDSLNTGWTIAQFSEGTEEAVKFRRTIPTGATNMYIKVLHRAQSAPGGSVNVQITLRARYALDGAALSSWTSEFDLTPWAMPVSSVVWNEDFQTFSLASLGIVANSHAQFLLSRQGADTDDTLTGAWNLANIVVGFA